MSPLAMAATLAILVVLAVMVGAAGSRAAVREPLRVRREGSVRPVSAWRIVPLVAGFGLLGLSWATAGEGSGHAAVARWLLPFGAGLALSALGLVLAVPFLAVAIGRGLHRSERPAALLAAGRLRHEPAVAGRILAGLTVALFAAGTAQVMLVAVRTGAMDVRRSSPIPAVELLEARVPAGAAEADLRAVSELGVAFPLVDFGPGVESGLDAVVASCDDLRSVIGAAVSGCEAGRTYLVTSPDPRDVPIAEPPARAEVALAPRGLPPAAGTLSFALRTRDTSYVPDLVIPPGLIPVTSGRWYVAFAGDAGTGQRAVAALAERFPAAQLSGGGPYVDRMDTPRLYSDVIAFGTKAALAVGLVALMVASIDRAVERRGALTHVAALGTPARTIRSALVLQTLPVSALALAAAGLAAVVGGSSYLRWDDAVPAGLPLDILTALIALSVAAAALATALAVAGSVARARPDLLRRE